MRWIKDSGLIRGSNPYPFFFDGDCQAITDQWIRHVPSGSRRKPAT